MIRIYAKFNDDGTVSVGVSGGDRKVRENKGESLLSFPDSFTVIDIETTGLDPAFDDIIELSAIRVRSDVVVDSFSALVQPPPYERDGHKQYVSDFISKLTGISNEMLETAETISCVLPRFLAFVGNDVLVGHNVNFDINFIYDNAESNLGVFVSNNFVDTKRLSYRFFHNTPRRLQCIAELCGINYDGAHRSLRDCEITLGCYLYMKKMSATQDWNSKKKHCPQNELRASKIVTQNTTFDETHPLYGKCVVFTGALNGVPRREAMQAVVDVGGMVTDGITKNTNYLVVGSFEYSANIKNGKSGKIRKAEEYKLHGQEIDIISENVFFDLLENK